MAALGHCGQTRPQSCRGAQHHRQRGARNAGDQPAELTAQRSRNSAPHCPDLRLADDRRGHEMFSYTRSRRGRMRNYWPLLPVAAILLAGAAVAVPARAAASQHPYRLVDSGTFGGPQSFLYLPALPLTQGGALLATDDTPTHETVYPKSNPFKVSFPDRYPVHPFAWH